MFSESLKETLEQEVVGQPRAIHSVVRGVTRILSGLTPMERSWCAYLFIGPPGTGRAHLVRTLARVVHGREALLTLNCNPGGHPDPWLWLTQQFAHLYDEPAVQAPNGRPLSLVLIHDLENANVEFYPVLARLLETGQLPLAGGRTASLENCIVFLTSNLCAEEILETHHMGFSGASTAEGEEEQERSLHGHCKDEAERVFGLDLLEQIDRLVVFRRLEDDSLGHVLDRHFARMSRWLALSGIRCELRPEARSFVLEHSTGSKHQGARGIVLTHRREVEFPLADLLLSRQLEAGTRVIVGHRPDERHLHFTVEAEAPLFAEPPVAERAVEVPVG